MAYRLDVVEDMLNSAYNEVDICRDVVRAHNTKENRNRLFHANREYNQIVRTLSNVGFSVVFTKNNGLKVIKEVADAEGV